MTSCDVMQLIQNKIPGEQTGITVKPTICAICEGGATSCGVNAYVKDGTVIKVEGMPEFPQNQGTLCAKGNAGRQYIYNKDRILTPLKRVGDRGTDAFEPISWQEAYDTIAEKLLAIKSETGPESVVFGVGFTKWLRPFAQRLALSFGSPNFATESSTCYLATQMAARLTYGDWGLPDLKNSACLLVWSRNPFYSGTPGAKKLIAARQAGLKIIEVSPMVTHLSRYADMRLGLRPGTDGALALGMAHVIIREDLYDKAFVADWTIGFDRFKAYTTGFTPEQTEIITGVPARVIEAAARLFATTKPASIMTSASPTVHHTNGVQNHRAITCLSGLTGNYDAPGGNHVVPESWLHVATGIPTRQHEFMLPRDLKQMAPRVGQSPFPLWADLTDEAQSVWLPFQIESRQPYPVRAVVAFGYNHRMWPGSDHFAKSLDKLDLFVDIDLFMTDTAKMADLVLPACSSFERSELRLYAGNHAILTQPVIPPLGDAKPDTDIIFELARRIAPEDELLQQGYDACLDWILLPSGLSVAELRQHPKGITLTALPKTAYHKYRANGFTTPSGKMEFVSAKLQEAGFDGLPTYKEPATSPSATPETALQFPLVLGTGTRLPMYIHSRTFRNTWNRDLHPHPTIRIHPTDAADRGIKDGEDVLLETPRHAVKAKARVTETIRPGAVNIYHGWPEIEVNQLIAPDYLDPISGYPGFKSLLCDVRKV